MNGHFTLAGNASDTTEHKYSSRGEAVIFLPQLSSEVPWRYSIPKEYLPFRRLDDYAMAKADDPTLFPMPEESKATATLPESPAAAGSSLGIVEPRLRRAERRQQEMRVESLDQRLPAEHLARDIWDYVNGLDLTALLQQIKATEGQVGRNATDPRILLSIWLYAFATGQGSARAVAKLCTSERAYEWLCGGVSLNYHLLADFRVGQWDYLNQLFTDSLAVLMQEGLLSLERTAQDGMRVRASAGKSSFRRQATLEKCLVEAQERVTELNRDFENGSAASTLREKAAQQRAAQERVERVNHAVQQVKEMAAQREARKKGSGQEARASTTDPDARNMKMPDGGFRPGFNVQFNTDTDSGLVVGVDVNNQGTDAGLMEPMLEQVEERTGKRPDDHLTDGGFATVEDIEKVSSHGTKVYTPIKEEEQKRAKGIDPFQPLRKDSPAIADWRQRMGTEEAKTIYKLRAQTAEWTNAQARNRGFYQVRIRGLEKVGMIALWYALIHNVLCARRLRAEKAQAASENK
jgi:transposase